MFEVLFIIDILRTVPPTLRSIAGISSFELFDGSGMPSSKEDLPSGSVLQGSDNDVTFEKVLDVLQRVSPRFWEEEVCPDCHKQTKYAKCEVCAISDLVEHDGFEKEGKVGCF